MSDITITAQEEREFQEFYEARLAQAGLSAATDREELEAARDILLAVINDGLTPDVDGKTSYVRRDVMDWTDPETIRAAQQVSGNGTARLAVGPSGAKGGMKDIIQGVAALLVALGVIIWYFWPESSAAEVPVTPEATEEAVVDGAATPTPVPTLESELLADIAGSAKTGLVTPRTLEIKGVSFVVQPVAASLGDWPLPDDERAVSWVSGTRVNYLLGLANTPENRQLVASLGPGDELLLRFSTGPAFRFAFADRVRVAPQASEVFRQTRPGLTLVLLGEEGSATRVVVRAVYLPESELGGGEAAAQAVGLGETVDLNTLRLTCLSARPEVRPETPPGHVFVVVGYRLRNTGESLPLLTGSFSHRLEAEGVAFPLAPVEGGALPATLQPGQAITATAAYVVPETRLAEPLRWVFSTGPSGPVVAVELPPAEGALRPQVMVPAARLEEGRLVITVTVQAGLREVVVDRQDLVLEGGSLSPVGTYFPWRVATGQSADFTLLVEPSGSPVRLGLLETGVEVRW